MKFGIFTPTEAAVVAAVYSFVVGMFIYRELKWSALYGLILTAGKTTAVVMFLVAAAMVIGLADHRGQHPGRSGRHARSRFMDNKMLLMFVIMVLVVVVGTALDFTPTVLILTPVLMPIVQQGRHRSGLFRRACSS